MGQHLMLYWRDEALDCILRNSSVVTVRDYGSSADVCG